MTEPKIVSEPDPHPAERAWRDGRTLPRRAVRLVKESLLRHWRAPAALIAAALLAAPMAAQEPTAPTVRDSAASDSGRADSGRADSVRRTHHALPAVVVTGTRLTDVDERTPTQVEPLDLVHAGIGPSTVFMSLEQLPGVSMYNDQGTRLQPEIEIRGFTVSPVVGSPQGVSVFLDGVRENEPDAQEVNFDLLPTAAIDHSTLVRGSDALFGRNSLGGTILLFTKRGTETPEASLQIGGGSYGEQDLSFSAGGMLHGTDGFIAGSGSNEVGWRQATSANTRNLFAQIGHRFSADPDSGADIVFSALYAHDRIDEGGSLPQEWVGPNPRINYTPGDQTAPELVQFGLRGTGPALGGILRTSLFGRRNDIEQFNGNVPPPNTNAYITNLSAGVTAEWTRPFLIGSAAVSTTVGIDYARENVHFRLTNVGGGAPDSTTTLANVMEDAAAAYAQVIVTPVAPLSITAAVRADDVHIPYRDRLDATNDGTSNYDQLSPEIGLTYQFTDDIKAYIGYKSGFRAPAPLELACAAPDAPCSLPSALGADPALRPVVSRDFESGLDVEVPRLRTSIDLDGFWTDVTNDIVFAAPNLTEGYFLNVPKTRRAGLEVAVATRLPAGFRVFGSYSYVAATFQSTIQIATSDTNPQPTHPGNLFPSSPLHHGRAGIGYGHQVGRGFLFDGSFDITGVSGQYLRGDESNHYPEMPGYAVGGLHARLTWTRYTAELDIDNLFDRRYASFGIIAQNQFGPTVGSTTIVADPETVPFLTPGYARRITIALSARL